MGLKEKGERDGGGEISGLREKENRKENPTGKGDISTLEITFLSK